MSDLAPPIGATTLARAVAGTIRGLVRPTRRDDAFLSTLTDAGLPTGSVTVTVRALPQVPRWAPTAIVAEGIRAPRHLALALTAFVVQHPSATILLDPGICADVRRRAVSELQAPLRVAVRPPVDLIPIRNALDRVGVGPEDVDIALPTHVHWDHVAGLLDLPDLPVHLHRTERAWAMDGDRAPVGGVRAALRGRPVHEYALDGPPVLSFPRSHDFFGDGSVVLVDLAGHTPGSVGVLLRTGVGTPDGWVLVAGDAVWHTTQIEALRPKAAFPGLLVDDDRAATLATLHRLYAVRDRVRIVPSHDRDAVTALS